MFRYENFALGDKCHTYHGLALVVLTMMHVCSMLCSSLGVKLGCHHIVDQIMS
jgi:hypothetical protein